MTDVTDNDISEPTAESMGLSGDHPGFDLARQAGRYIAETTGVAQHRIAVVLGSGWSGATDLLGDRQTELPTGDIPGFTSASVAGHGSTVSSIARRSAEGTVTDHVLVFGSRTHYYEHRDVNAVAHTVRTAAATGAELVVLTNGSGSVNEALPPGEPVLISDHLNLTGATPLLGPEFIDLTDLYSPRIREIARSVDPSLAQGVYVQFPGPQYETPAEVRMAKLLGGDLVGMSTALDAIAARHAGLEVFGMSLVTNQAAGISQHPLSHHEVIEAGRAAQTRISHLLASIIDKL
ncbi:MULTISPECIES: purine-nucleoside phosphorylase [Auritidibacter]|uniref:purine-nucleoside phosphorylase n=1 Tax=Auritidibacter TaxID=1160973 RepID=UPI000D726025|nr:MULTISPECIES: purine-nucleoside phosphorylase [Auritidibacter]PXA77259.1 purine-nucleoside phosphorylase [Auritidibacter sp. NML100628]WHS27449.1 purine-nucleoside phosphorylase [Auritidibacter ignavus]